MRFRLALLLLFCPVGCGSTTMTVGGVRVRATVDGAARVRRGLLAPPAGQQAQQGRYDGQHEDQASNADADSEAALRYAYAVFHSLKGKYNFCSVQFYTGRQRTQK